MKNDHLFLVDLFQRPHAHDSYNPYFDGEEWGRVRGRNLQRYLSFMQERQPTTLMLMEAPGYRGCRVTGIPVTSRNVMLSGILGDGYEDTHEIGFEAFNSEQSATIVWETLATMPTLPVIWNTFPFHPHQAGNRISNRTPRPAEIREGVAVLENVLAMFQPSRTIAVGNVAAKALAQLNLPYTRVRHPAQGGKHDFVAGMLRELNESVDSLVATIKEKHE
jgi:uracil-DNA glycosylase